MPRMPLVQQDLPVFFDVGRVGSAVPKRAGGGALCAGQSSSTRGRAVSSTPSQAAGPKAALRGAYLPEHGGTAHRLRRQRRGAGLAAAARLRVEAAGRQSVWVLLGGSSPPDPVGRRLLGRRAGIRSRIRLSHDPKGADRETEEGRGAEGNLKDRSTTQLAFLLAN
jgi:hypothetical protein